MHQPVEVFLCLVGHLQFVVFIYNIILSPIGLFGNAVHGNHAVCHHGSQLQTFFPPPLQLVCHGLKLVCYIKQRLFKW